MTPAFDKIMCAVDFSGFSEEVLHAGKEMARRFGSTLWVFHSVCFPRERFSDVFDEQKTKGEKESVQKAQRKIESLMKASEVPWKPLVMVGDPVENAAVAARTEGIHMIMAASYGMSGFKRLFLGTVVERLAGLQNTPLMVLRPRHRVEPESRGHAFKLGRIAVCCFLEPPPATLVEYGVALAKGWEADLILVHSLEAPPVENGMEPDLCSYEDAQEKMLNRVRTRLETLVPREQRQGIHVRFEVLLGVPGEQIQDFIEASAVDLVIVGGPQHSPLGSFIIGSTTQFLIRHAPCAVLRVASG